MLTLAFRTAGMEDRGMDFFDISDENEDELVLIVPEYLVARSILPPTKALKVAKAAVAICRKRWPKAYVRIATAQNYEVSDPETSFILVAYGSQVGDDFATKDWAEHGAMLKERVVQTILNEAMIASGISVKSEPKSKKMHPSPGRNSSTPAKSACRR